MNVAELSSEDCRALVRKLTKREEQVLVCVCNAGGAKQAAEMLRLSPYTVSQYLKSVYDKIGAESMVHAAVIATKAGLL